MNLIPLLYVQIDVIGIIILLLLHRGYRKKGKKEEVQKLLKKLMLTNITVLTLDILLVVIEGDFFMLFNV